LLIVAAVWMAGLARTAAASPVQLELLGDACTLDTLEAEVTHLASPEVAAGAPTRVRVETSREADAYSANVWFPERTDGRRGPRVVSAATCTQLTESVALVIAMALTESRAPAAAVEADPPAVMIRTRSLLFKR
jgi:hypothetical protein